MRGALPRDIRASHESYYLATSTAMAVALYEEADAAAHRAAA